MHVGVLALQGAVGLHQQALEHAGATTMAVKTASDLELCDALVLPGGESTTISMMLERNELFDPLAARIAAGLPVFGTCAGMILLASEVSDGRDDQRFFGAIDIGVRRNAFGTQLDSFEADLPIDVLGDPAFPAVFIRAPIVERVGEGVEVLAEIDGRAVLCRQGPALVAAFHPELADDDLRLHALFLETCAA